MEQQQGTTCIKLFHDSSYEALNGSVNEWLKENSRLYNISEKDITFNFSFDANNTPAFGVMIVYKTK